MRRLILFVEGDGEAEAVPTLVKRLLNEKGAWHDILLDDATFRVGSVDKLVKADFRDWKRFLGASLKRSNVGGVLLILDGDSDKVEGKGFCAAEVAKSFAAAARQVGAGETFSVAVVFAVKEYETWLIAGAASLAGKRLSDGRSLSLARKLLTGISKQVQGTPRGGFAASLPEATDRPAIRQHLPSWSTLKLFGHASFGRSEDSSPPCRACCRRSEATDPSFRRPDRPRALADPGWSGHVFTQASCGHEGV